MGNTKGKNMDFENVKMKLFNDVVGTIGCSLEKEVNEFLERKDIEVCDIKVSNSERRCVICVFYRSKPIHACWIDGSHGSKICSNCNGSAFTDFDKSSFEISRYVPMLTDECPHCGAKMDEDI